MGKLLAIDVSNSLVEFGVFEQRRLLRHWSVQTVEGRTADEYAVWFRSLLGAPEIAGLKGAVVASVVPAVTGIMTELCRQCFDLELLVVGPGVRSGMAILYDKPQDVGADRIVNALAAYERTRDTTIVVDFATTTVFDYISAAGDYVGGIICPGLSISSEALFARAARLYRVELRKPATVIGRNTVSAVQSGLVNGHVAMVDGLIERIQEAHGVRARILATGALAHLVAPHSQSIERVERFLTLEGLRLIYERNR